MKQLPHSRGNQKPGDDRKQANDFCTALTAHITFSLTEPCLDMRGLKRNCQISIINHNTLYRWKHVRTPCVVDLKRSDLLWWKVYLPLKFFIFCPLDPVCYSFAKAFMKLANLLYHCSTSACLVCYPRSAGWKLFALSTWFIKKTDLLLVLLNYLPDCAMSSYFKHRPPLFVLFTRWHRQPHWEPDNFTGLWCLNNDSELASNQY